MSTNDGTQKQNTVEVENHHCSKCGLERLLWRPQDKCAHVLICPLCLMTRPHSSQECDKYTGIRIEKLEVQVEVYRKALEELWAWKESDTVKGWFQMAHIHGSRVSEEYFKKVEDMNSRIKALLTSKPEPVAPICEKCGDKGWYYKMTGGGPGESLDKNKVECLECKPVAPVRKWEMEE